MKYFLTQFYYFLVFLTLHEGLLTVVIGIPINNYRVLLVDSCNRYIELNIPCSNNSYSSIYLLQLSKTSTR